MSVKLKQVFSGKRLDEVHALYETAFPASEKKPFSMIVFRGRGDRAGGRSFPWKRIIGFLVLPSWRRRETGYFLTILPSRMKCGGMEPALRHFRRSVRDIKA